MKKSSKPGRLLIYAVDRGYKAMHDGSIVSPRGRMLKLANNGTGYQVFSVGGPTRELRGPVKAAYLMAFQKFGEALFEPGVEVRHLNGVRSDDSYENILIGTRSENQMDIPEDVRKVRAAKAREKISAPNHIGRRRRKISYEQATDIRLKRSAGYKYKDLAAEYGLAQSTIYSIINMETYTSA